MNKFFYILFVAGLLFTQNVFAQEFTSLHINVDGACGMCKERIEKTAKMHGVRNPIWNPSTKILTLSYNPGLVSAETIQEKIAEAGHDTEYKKATDEAYNALPDCCHYRDVGSDHSASDNLKINGIVLSEDHKGKFSPLPGATITWLTSGKAVTSDENGAFSIHPEEANDKLIVSYAGYTSDTLSITNMNDVQIILGSNHVLKAVQVTSAKRNSFINTFSPFRTQTINSGELLKAACCNLSESFETNPSVDVSFSDAVTGSKQIQLLGLSGIYTQLTVENLPGPRGLATPLGLNSIAGPWIESIQLSKGTGSVVNGYESIAGQINVELVRPKATKNIYLNGYVNNMGRADFNANILLPLNKKWSTELLLHEEFQRNKTDFNKDGFRDQPTGSLFSAVNRWSYNDSKGLSFEFGGKMLDDDKTGGELDFKKAQKFSSSVYGVGIDINRYEGFAKIGYIFPKTKYQSIGLQISGFHHNQDAFLGLREYKGSQNNFYSNLIYQSIIKNTNHKFRTGLSFNHDGFDETFATSNFTRDENVMGGYFEYTWQPVEKFTLVAGMRGDYNSLYGWFGTPRLNLRYEPITGTIIRVSGGRGQRTANVLAENMGHLVSARTLNIIGEPTVPGFGLKPEVAWNKGISIDQKLKMFGRAGMISIDFYRNDFTNQVVIDLESPQSLNIYNLDGKSFSNSFQTEISFIPVKALDVKVAYRWFDVKTTYGGKLIDRPFTATHRAFVNLGYGIKGWKFDYTVNFVGQKRIPFTGSNPVAYQLATKSPSYITMNTQVSKMLHKKSGFELYIGAENITGYIQKHAIIAADEPFGNYFDASLIWGPLTERMFYGGFRINIR